MTALITTIEVIDARREKLGDGVSGGNIRVALGKPHAIWGDTWMWDPSVVERLLPVLAKRLNVPARRPPAKHPRSRRGAPSP